MDKGNEELYRKIKKLLVIGENADRLHESLLVSDIIYNPRKTPLLKMAEAAGCRAINGMDMLLFQGAKAFEIWTGKEMPTDKIRTDIMEKYM